MFSNRFFAKAQNDKMGVYNLKAKVQVLPGNTVMLIWKNKMFGFIQKCRSFSVGEGDRMRLINCILLCKMAMMPAV